MFLTTTTEPDIFILVLLKIFTSGSILGGAGAVRHFQIPNSTRSPSRIRPRFDHHQIPKTQVLFLSLNFPLKIFQYSIRNSHSHHDHVISHLTFLSLLA